MEIDPDVRHRIVERFGSDPDFRERLIANPGATLKDAFGIDLPFPVRFSGEGGEYRIEPVSGTGEPLVLRAPSYGEGKIFCSIISNNGQT